MAKDVALPPERETLDLAAPFDVARTWAGDRFNRAETSGLITGSASAGFLGVGHGTASVGSRFTATADVENVGVVAILSPVVADARATAYGGVASAESWATLRVVDERGAVLCSARRSFYHAHAVVAGSERSPQEFQACNPACNFDRPTGADATYLAVMEVEGWASAHGGANAMTYTETVVRRLEVTLRR